MKNKYKNISILLIYFSVLMVIAMTIHLFVKYQTYLQHPEYSAPFSVYSICISVPYISLIIIGFIVSIVFRNKALNR